MNENNKNEEEADLKQSVCATSTSTHSDWVASLKLLDPKEYQQLYWVFKDANYRCTRITHHSYNGYGARGIKFLFDSFEDWLQELGPRPPGYEQDRINNDGHYEKGNVRWVNRSAQQKNKRIYTTNTSGIRGVNFVNSSQLWVTRCNNNNNGKRDYLYVGKDFFEACCARLSWESHQSEVKIRNRRGKDFERDQSKLGV